MKSIVAICGMVLLSSAATANNLETTNESKLKAEIEILASQHPWGYGSCISCKDTAELDLDKIIFIEEEEPFDLGFDTSDYLPEGFDPYKVYVDLDAINFIEDEEIELGFNTSDWLPAGFNAYAAPADFNSVSYIETEDDLFVDLDTKAWLPEGFDPYASETEPKKSCRLAYDPINL